MATCSNTLTRTNPPPNGPDMNNGREIVDPAGMATSGNATRDTNCSNEAVTPGGSGSAISRSNTRVWLVVFCTKNSYIR